MRGIQGQRGVNGLLRRGLVAILRMDDRQVDVRARISRVLQQKLLETQLGIEEMPFVIGRINDVGLYGDEKRKAAWTRMRKVQEKLGNDDPLGTWIDTDDFITEEHKHAKGNIHYLGDMPVKLGERFGEAALKQLEAK